MKADRSYVVVATSMDEALRSNRSLLFGFGKSHFNNKRSRTTKPGVPNLGYICLSEGVHLRLSIEEQNTLAYNLFPNIYTYISEYSFQKSLYAYCEVYL